MHWRAPVEPCQQPSCNHGRSRCGCQGSIRLAPHLPRPGCPDGEGFPHRGWRSARIVSAGRRLPVSRGARGRSRLLRWCRRPPSRRPTGPRPGTLTASPRPLPGRTAERWYRGDRTRRRAQGAGRAAALRRILRRWPGGRAHGQRPSPMPALDLAVRASVSSAHYVERLGQHSTAGCHASGHILIPSKAILATAPARASLPEDVRSSYRSISELTAGAFDPGLSGGPVHVWSLGPPSPLSRLAALSRVSLRPTRRLVSARSRFTADLRGLESQ